GLPGGPLCLGSKEKAQESPPSTTAEELEPVPCVLQGDDIQALAIKVEDLEKLHTPRPPQDAGKASVRKKYFVRKHQPKETKETQLLVACPAFPKVPTAPLTFAGPGRFGDGCEKILPHHILGGLQEFRMEALARGNTRVSLAVAEGVTRSAAPVTGCFLSIEVLQRPENELLMSISEGYRQIQEERDLIDRTLPGYRKGSEFWSQPERIGSELTGLTMTLTQSERGYPEPVTHVGKPHTVRMETGLKPPKRIPFHLTWDKSLFLKHRRQELKSILEELDFYKPDLDGLEVIGKGQPFTSDLTGIAARLTFETLVGEKAESPLTVSNNGTAAIWYNWMRLPHKIPSRERKGKRMQCFYFDTRPGVILPGEMRKFSFIFKSERVGIFSEAWEFRTHPLLLAGAVLQVTLWGIAVSEDKLADLREKLESDLAAREGAAIVEDSIKELLGRIRTPERTPSPMDAYVTEEELFHRKNPELHYQYEVVKQLHELWRQHMTEENVPLGQTSVEDMRYQESIAEGPSAQSSIIEVMGWRNSLEGTPSQMLNVEEQEPTPSGWNLSLEDFKQAVKSIPMEEQREAALAQLNKAALDLCVPQRPPQSDLLHQICLQLWREAIDALVGASMKLRSLLGLPGKDTYVEVPEEPGNSRKLRGKDDKKIKSSLSLLDVKGGAQPMEGAEPPREQLDSVLFGIYQEKLYTEVSLCPKLVSWFWSLLVSLH
uniref:MYCBP associated protein n=1 Tax=Amazona collaria TaxID=241587 RepID=A0A8B9F3B1_9PSIT